MAGEIERHVDARRVARRRRRLLPRQRPEPRAGGHAGALRRRLPGDRRHALLRARRDQGRPRLPHAAREPARRGVLRAGGQLAAAGHRRHLAGADRVPREHDRASRSSTSRCAPEDVPGLGAAAVKAVGRFMETMEKLRDRAEGASVGRPAPGDARRTPATSTRCEAERTIEAQGRLENLEELVGVAREYDASARRALGRGVPPAGRALLRAGRLSDDEGIVTLMTLHNAKGLEYDIVFMIGLRGRDVPALALDRGGRHRGGAPPLLRRASRVRARSSS